jgi:DNA primase large subunit
MELISYPIARMICACVNDPYLKKRYSLAEAKRAYRRLIKEDEKFIMKMAKEFDIGVNENLNIYFTDYLRYSPSMSNKWKLINRPLNKGWIHLPIVDLARLIQESLREKIYSEMINVRPSKKMFDALNKEIELIKNGLTMRQAEYGEIETGAVSIAKFPPCMKKLLGAVQSGLNVPHVGRFALVTFLHSIGLDAEEILNLFITSPDFDEGKTRYQIEHITGKISSTEYAAPQCQTMKSWGICFDSDNLCKRINHPLSYYREKWKYAKKENEKKK